MLVVNRKKFFLKIAEVYFCEQDNANAQDVDVIMYVQSSHDREGAKQFHTLQIDLSKEEDLLFQELGKNNRYKIKRAEKQDHVTFTILTSPEDKDIDDFLSYYNIFAKTKQLPKGNRQKLAALQEMNAIAITEVKDEQGNRLCAHVYVLDQERVRLLYSASHFRQLADSAQRSLIGRANRYLHWLDIKEFKELGYRTYDFGGLALEGAEGETGQIDEFKRGFGGRIVTEFNYFQPKSALGKMAVKLFI
ncbi:GNAT family N-acetyltransferase [Brevibacillus daliensis]|uniref:GNAT family N-acetyltransferase n=1 Tax=Brevibacillus daliensis TaxID=2892995 RepID=UPI001E5E025A|nr:GNAT family N-acetyltransferase [Brevibacillus daliensis]